MGFTLVAVALGLLLGLAAGGRPRFVADHPIHGMALLVAGLLLQVLGALVNLGGAANAAILGSYALLVAFAVVNVRLVGMAIVTLGLAANFVVIAVNGGMPVRAGAIISAGASAAQVPHLHYGSKRHLERPSDRITFLADVVPVAPLHEVVSFGDLVMAVGVADVIFHLLQPRKGLVVTGDAEVSEPVPEDEEPAAEGAAEQP
jgi:hypothetical protein